MFTKMVEAKSFTAVSIPKFIPYGILGLLAFIIIEWIIPEQPIQHETSVTIPSQADWTDYGPIFEQGAVGEWDYQLWGGFAGTAVKYNGTYYLYYQGASGYQLVPDETVTWRAIGVASSPDGVNFTKYNHNPVVTWFPTQDGEEGAASGGATLNENGDIALIYGANTSVGPTSVHADGRLSTSTDGINFTDMGIVLDHQDNTIWGFGDELFPVIAFQDNGQWFVYYIPNGTGTNRTLGAAWGNSPTSLTNSKRVVSGGTPVKAWGMGGYAKVDMNVYALFINDVTQAKTEVRTISLTNPEEASAPIATYQFPEATQATILLDEDTNTWFMYYRGIDEYGLKLAPAGTPDTTPPTAPSNVTAVPLNDREIELTWDPATDTETGIVQYHVFRDGVLIATVKGWHYRDAGLVEHTDYSYEISAVNYHGITGSLSSPVIATTLADITPPQLISAHTDSNPNQVILRFSEPLASDSIEQVGHFAINYATVNATTVAADQQTITLTTSIHVHDNYIVTANNIKDQAIEPNTITSTLYMNYIFTGIDGLVGAWSFDDTVCDTGGVPKLDVVMDTSNFGTGGLLRYLQSTGPTRTQGQIGRALQFNGLDDQITISGEEFLEDVTSSSHTFAAWVYPDSIPPNTNANDSAYSIFVRAYTGLYYDADQTFRAGIKLADGSRIVISSAISSPEEWHHVVMVVDDLNKELHLYVDGQEVNNSPVGYTGSLADHGEAPYYVGTSEPLTNRYEYRFHGVIDEVLLFNRNLSLADIDNLFQWVPHNPFPVLCIHMPLIEKSNSED